VVVNKRRDFDIPFVGLNQGMKDFVVIKKINRELKTLLSFLNQAKEWFFEVSIGKQWWRQFDLSVSASIPVVVEILLKASTESVAIRDDISFIVLVYRLVGEVRRTKQEIFSVNEESLCVRSTHNNFDVVFFKKFPGHVISNRRVSVTFHKNPDAQRITPSSLRIDKELCDPESG
jgi:hypothetical protein